MSEIRSTSAGTWITVERLKDIGTSIPALPFRASVIGSRDAATALAHIGEVIDFLVGKGVPSEEAAAVKDLLRAEVRMDFHVPPVGR